MTQQRAIRVVRDGFHRHDKVARDAPFLRPDAPPRKGDGVKIQTNLFVPLPASIDLEEEVDWLALTGVGTEVINDDFVIAEVEATTSLHPEDFHGGWLVRLRREGGWDFPWKLAHISPAKSEPVLSRGFVQGDGFGFRVAWLVREASHALGELSASTGGIDAPLDFLPLSFPTGGRTTTLWSVAAGDGPESAATQLLLSGSDAIITDGVSPFTDEVLHGLSGDPALIHWERQVAPQPIVPLQSAVKQLLTELRYL
jgi:hypothetical protein